MVRSAWTKLEECELICSIFARIVLKIVFKKASLKQGTFQFLSQKLFFHLLTALCERQTNRVLIHVT